MAASARRRIWRACCSTSQLGLNPTLGAYRGTGPALNDVIGGHVDFFCEQVVSVAARGQRRHDQGLWWCRGNERSPALPDVPSAKEAACRNSRSISGARSSRPRARRKPIVAKLADALNKTLNDPAVHKRLAELGGTVPAQADRGPELLAELLRADIARGIRSCKAAARSQDQIGSIQCRTHDHEAATRRVARPRHRARPAG